MTRVSLLVALGLVALALAACSPESGPQAGGQTNWLRACASSQACGGLECLCGACMATCESDAECADLPDASCIAASDEQAIAVCGGQAPPSGLCLPAAPSNGPSSTIRVTIDDAVRHQTLVGFGASLAYADDAIVAHPDKAALYDLLFAESGLDVLRLRNRYEPARDAELLAAREIIAAASQHLGRTPFLFMSSGTPPAALKANASRTCGGDPETCTLASRPGGGFDYTGFAEYWRASLAAYASAGILPDYISIQNNPNWVPPAEAPNEACRFLPEEGTTTVTVDGAPIAVAYPGYREALAAVRSAVSELPSLPRLGAPESGPLGISEFVPRLDPSTFDALALHLYGMDATAVDVAALETIRGLAEQRNRPVFQTEMQAGGLDTAILIHHALTAGGASAYVQNDLVSVTAAGAPVALARLTRDGFEPQGPYYALSHYAKSTDPGWIRVDATSDSTQLLGSAWLAPDESALTIVLVNPGDEALDAELVLPGELAGSLVRSEVTHTVFEGAPRSAALGELPADGIVRVPGRSILTAALAIE